MYLHYDDYLAKNHTELVHTEACSLTVPYDREFRRADENEMRLQMRIVLSEEMNPI